MIVDRCLFAGHECFWQVHVEKVRRNVSSRMQSRGTLHSLKAALVPTPLMLTAKSQEQRHVRNRWWFETSFGLDVDRPINSFTWMPHGSSILTTFGVSLALTTISTRAHYALQ